MNEEQVCNFPRFPNKFALLHEHKQNFYIFRTLSIFREKYVIENFLVVIITLKLINAYIPPDGLNNIA